MKTAKKQVKKVPEKSEGIFARVMRSKGFYIALCALAAMIGITIYARHLQADVRNKVASFDDAAWNEAVEESSLQIIDVDGIEQAKQNVTEKKSTEAVAVVKEIDGDGSEKDEKTEKTSSKTAMQSPCTGQVLAACSLDDLVYCEATDDWRTHNGTDIAAEVGSSVVAVADGVVAKVYEDELLGVVVVLDHGDGLSSLYGNLLSFDFIRAGTEVKGGDIIGSVGKSGTLEANAEPHLHFELSLNGEYQNPEEYIAVGKETNRE